MSEYQQMLTDVEADLETANATINECEQLVGVLEKRANNAEGATAEAYKQVVADIQQDVASAKAQIPELETVKRFVETRLNGKGGGGSPAKPAAKSLEKPTPAKPAPAKRDSAPPITPPKAVPPSPQPAATEGSMNTIEFGPDGFPIT